MIKPTIGRVVHYYPMHHDEVAQPFAALITYVHNDRLVNLAYFDAGGVAGSAKVVTLLQDDEIAADGSDYCCWMPFQKGQAQKAEALEKELAAKV